MDDLDYLHLERECDALRASNAELLAALEVVHARRIAWPKVIEDQVVAAIAIAKGIECSKE